MVPHLVRCPDCGEIAEHQGDGEYVCEVCGFCFTDEDIDSGCKCGKDGCNCKDDYEPDPCDPYYNDGNPWGPL